MEVGLDDIQRSSQAAPKRFGLFKAPSSTGDLAAGFAFSKAVKPQLNIGRQKPTNPSDVPKPTSPVSLPAAEQSVDSKKHTDGESSGSAVPWEITDTINS